MPVRATKSFTQLLLLAIALVVSAAGWEPAPELQVFLIGDSTMADKPGTPQENPERGWGQLLPTFFNEQVAVRNHAVNGRSSKSFLDEGRWEAVLRELRPGDYVFIQFGHNDQKVNDPKRYTNPWTGYRRNLERFIDETRARGAFPLVLSSIVRRKFNDEGTLLDTHGVYPFVARQVAAAKGVPFIDMQLLTEDLVVASGPEASKDIYLWVEPGQYPKAPEGKQDDTHLSLYGATTYAGLVAEALRALELPLARYLKNQ